jgi:hypothetical protein
MIGPRTGFAVTMRTEGWLKGGYAGGMSDAPDVLEGWVDGTPFVVRRVRLSPHQADPIESKFWKWWMIEVNGVRHGQRFRASTTDTPLSVVQQARLILRHSLDRQRGTNQAPTS